ncbi:UNVERIFIED_CONTAM: hypothetical protein GTU68_026881 [Idotea baltica]|nr:hypothetical protein [Idotea baltica]
MVEVKSGETYNGILMGVDKYMNLKLADAILTNSGGTKFHQIKEVYIRGNTLKYFNLDDSSIKKIEGTQYKAP